MKHILLAGLIVLLSTSLNAEVNLLSVSDEASYSNASDFTNTFELNFHKTGSAQIGKCQGVRLRRNWFITAAHCVENICAGACSVQARLIVGTNYELDLRTSSPRIYKQNKQSKDSKKNAGYDIALIFFPPQDSRLDYMDPSTHSGLNEKRFLSRIPNAQIYSAATKATNIPTIASIDSTENIMLNKKLSVASIWDGRRDVLKNKNPVFYSPKQHYIFTKNFGIKQGISGSGVMTNTGELIGVVTAIVTITITNPDGKTKDVHLALMTAFDNYIINFIATHIDDIYYEPLDKDVIQPVPPADKSFVNGFSNIL